MKRRLVAGLTALGVLLASAGCVQVPQPVTGGSPVRPALPASEVKPVMDHIDSVDDDAWAHHDESLLSTILTGTELYEEQAGIRLDRQLGDDDKGTTVKDGDYSDSFVGRSTRGGRYPAIAVVYETETIKKKTSRYVFLLERESASSPWLESFGSDNNLGKHRLRTEPDEPSVLETLSPTTKINSLTAERVTSLLANALQNPSGQGAKKFLRDKTFTGNMATPDTNKKYAPHRTKQSSFSPNNGTMAFPTTDGGMVVFGQLSARYTWQWLGGWYGIPTEPDDKKLLPGKGYTYMQYIDDDDFAVIVPPHGKLTLATFDSTWVSLTGDLDPDAK